MSCAARNAIQSANKPLRRVGAPGPLVTPRAAIIPRLAAFVAGAFLCAPGAAHSGARGVVQMHESLVASPANKEETAMNQHFAVARLVLAAGCVGLIASACGGSDDAAIPPVTIDAGTPNTVSRWDATATATINQPNAAAGTPEEVQSVYAVDLASVHIAMYDAVVAIAGGYKPFFVAPAAPGDGASEDAAASAAAYGVLKGLFPSRRAQYQPTYDAQLAAIADGSAKTRGVALGAEVAAGVLAARANDGRSVALAPFVPGTGPGQYRGPVAVARSNALIRPFTLTSAAQFRASGPPALNSAAYAADFNETRTLGGATSTIRSADQATIARFHTEGPSAFWPRNLRPFTMTARSLADQARLGALHWVTHADATIACFDSKYFHLKDAPPPVRRG